MAFPVPARQLRMYSGGEPKSHETNNGDRRTRNQQGRTKAECCEKAPRQHSESYLSGCLWRRRQEHLSKAFWTLTKLHLACFSSWFSIESELNA